RQGLVRGLRLGVGADGPVGAAVQRPVRDGPGGAVCGAIRGAVGAADVGAVGEGHACSRVCMRVVRAARTTMSPCWLRPVWTRSTTDWPGLERESRTERISVSE